MRSDCVSADVSYWLSAWWAARTKSDQNLRVNISTMTGRLWKLRYTFVGNEVGYTLICLCRQLEMLLRSWYIFAVWHTLVERLEIDLILATETISLRTTFTTWWISRWCVGETMSATVGEWMCFYCLFVEEEHTTEKHGKMKKSESGFRYLKREDRRSSMFCVIWRQAYVILHGGTAIWRDFLATSKNLS